jgi:hypothetical protein
MKFIIHTTNSGISRDMGNQTNDSLYIYSIGMNTYIIGGQGSSVSMATNWRLDYLGFEPR